VISDPFPLCPTDRRCNAVRRHARWPWVRFVKKNLPARRAADPRTIEESKTKISFRAGGLLGGNGAFVGDGDAEIPTAVGRDALV